MIRSLHPVADAQTAIAYMSAETENVLWVLNCGPQSDAAFHSGADIALLSQFAGECEGMEAAL